MQRERGLQGEWRGCRVSSVRGCNATRGLQCCQGVAACSIKGVAVCSGGCSGMAEGLQWLQCARGRPGQCWKRQSTGAGPSLLPGLGNFPA